MNWAREQPLCVYCGSGFVQHDPQADCWRCPDCGAEADRSITDMELSGNGCDWRCRNERKMTMRTILSIEPEEALAMVGRIQRILWHNGTGWNADAEWSAETSKRIADVLAEYDLRPDTREAPPMEQIHMHWTVRTTCIPSSSDLFGLCECGARIRFRPVSGASPQIIGDWQPAP